MKLIRHKKILEIVRNNTVSTQEELQELLMRDGFTTTQATISRDIRELRLIKTMTPSGGYCYALPQEHIPVQFSAGLNSVFLESIKTVDYAGNFVVVKCFSGMANAVCATIDNVKWEGLVGTLAGDDTIFILMRTEETAREFCEYVTGLTRKGQ